MRGNAAGDDARVQETLETKQDLERALCKDDEGACASKKVWMMIKQPCINSSGVFICVATKMQEVGASDYE